MIRTCEHRSAASLDWDAIIVGAGPAGSVAAHQLAIAGAKVLLVDKAIFPRSKVCGCCVGPTALSTLASIGLEDLPRRLGAIPLTGIHLTLQGRALQVRHDVGMSLSRTAFDTELVRVAVAKGAEFLPNARATLRHTSSYQCSVSVRVGSQDLELRARAVIAADGLGSSLLRSAMGFRWERANASHVGVGSRVHAPPREFVAGIVYMAVAREGYVGLVRLEDGSLDIAAALSPAYIKQTGHLGDAVQGILDSSGLPPFDVCGLQWRGTPFLTQRVRPVAVNRVFAVGDAAAYVEPFTGEGIAWAMATGVQISSLLCAAGFNPQLATGLWNRTFKHLLEARMRQCSIISRAIRSPLIAQSAMRFASVVPTAASLLLRSIHAPLAVQTLAYDVPITGTAEWIA